MIVDTFHFRGRLYIVTEFGDIYRVIESGPTPIDWAFELVCTLNGAAG